MGLNQSPCCLKLSIGKGMSETPQIFTSVSLSKVPKKTDGFYTLSLYSDFAGGFISCESTLVEFLVLWEES